LSSLRLTDVSIFVPSILSRLIITGDASALDSMAIDPHYPLSLKECPLELNGIGVERVL
jgi:hypothetical protein